MKKLAAFRRILPLLLIPLVAWFSSCSRDPELASSNRAAAKAASTNPSTPASGSAPATSTPQRLPIADQVAQPFSKRVEFGKDTGVFLEVPRDSNDAAGLLATPGVIGADLAGGFGPAWPGALLTCRPLAAGERKRVLVNCAVALRSGYLEHLISHGGKRHESVLWADVDCAVIHAALLAAGAKPGKPVQFASEEPKRSFRPASGDRIRITLQYEQDGQLSRVPAQQWIRYAKTKKVLDQDWVFAGSYQFKTPDGQVVYAANEGRYICVANFSNAMLDLPFKSQEGDPQHGLDFEANSEAIPPEINSFTVLGLLHGAYVHWYPLPPIATKVLMILEPLGPEPAKP